MKKTVFIISIICIQISYGLAQVTGVINANTLMGPLESFPFIIFADELGSGDEPGVGQGVLFVIRDAGTGEFAPGSGSRIVNIDHIEIDADGRPTEQALVNIQETYFPTDDVISGQIIDISNESAEAMREYGYHLFFNPTEFRVPFGATPGATFTFELFSQDANLRSAFQFVDPQSSFPIIGDIINGYRPNDVGRLLHHTSLFYQDITSQSGNLKLTPVRPFVIRGGSVGYINTVEGSNQIPEWNQGRFLYPSLGSKSFGKPSTQVNGSGKAGQPLVIDVDNSPLPTFREALDRFEVDLEAFDGTTTHYSFSDVPFTLVPNQDVARVEISGNASPNFSDFSFSESFQFSNTSFPDLGGIDFTSVDISGIHIEDETATLDFIYGLNQDESGNSISLEEESDLLRKVFLQTLAIPNHKQYISLDILPNPTRGHARVNEIFKRTDLARFFYEADVQMKKDVLKEVIGNDENGNAILQKWVELIQTDPVKWQQLTSIGFNSYPYLSIRGTILPRVTRSSNEDKNRLFLASSDIGFSLDRNIDDLGIDLSSYSLTPELRNYVHTQLNAFRAFLAHRLNQEADSAIPSMNAGEGAYRNLQKVLSAVIAAHWYKSLDLPNDPYAQLIDSEDLTGIESAIPFNQEFWNGQAYQFLGVAQFNGLYGNPISIELKGGVNMQQLLENGQEIPLNDEQDQLLTTLQSESATTYAGKYYIDGGQGSVQLPEVSINSWNIPYEESVPSRAFDFVFEGSVLDVGIEVLNSGNKAANHIKVDLFSIKEEVRTKVGSTVIPTLNIGETQSVQFPYVAEPDLFGELRLEAQVQLNPSTNQELNSDNNISLITIPTIDPRPSIYGLEPMSGSSVPNQNASFRVFASDINGDSLNISWVSDIDGLLSAETQFTAPNLTPGYHTITLTIENSAGFKREISLIVFAFEGNPGEPVLDINHPLENDSFRTHQRMYAVASAVDFLDGNLCQLGGNQISWVSSLDGELATGCTPSFTFLTAGLHTLTVTATNSANQSVSKSIDIQVSDGTPDIAITNIFPPGPILETDPVTLSAAANDADEGNISHHIIWSSSIQGYLGTGNTITRNLDPGKHLFTASVSNALGVENTSISDTIEISPLTTDNQLFRYVNPGTYDTSISVRTTGIIHHVSWDVQGISTDVSVPDGATLTFPNVDAPTAIDPVSIPAFPLANIFYGIAGNNTGGVAMICPDFTIPESPNLNLVESVFLSGSNSIATFLQLYVESGARIGFTQPYEVYMYVKRGGNITFLHSESTGTIYYEDGAFINRHDQFPSGVNLVRVPNLIFQYPNGTPICTAPLVNCPPNIGTSLSGSFSSAFALGESKVFEVDYHPNAARYHWTLPLGWTATPLNGNGNKIQITAPNVPSSGFLRVNNSNDCASSGTISLSISSGLSTTRPTNPSIDVLGDSTVDWNIEGPFISEQGTNNFADVINQYLSTYTGTEEFVDIPLQISYQGGGQFIGTNLSIEYGGQDIAITQIDAGSQPMTFRNRFSPAPIYVSVKNTGAEALSDVDAALLINGEEVVRSDQYANIPVGQTDTISFQWPYDTIGTHTLTVVLDPDHFIEEIDESNNRDSIIIRLIDKRPPTIALLSPPLSFPLGQEVEIGALIQDNLAVSDVHLSFNGVDFPFTNPQEDSLYVAFIRAEEEGSYLLTIQAMDASGKTTTLNRVIEVVDERPDIAMLPRNISAQINDLNEAAIELIVQNTGGTDVDSITLSVLAEDEQQIYLTTFSLGSRQDTVLIFEHAFPQGIEGIQPLQFVTSTNVEERRVDNNSTTRYFTLYDRVPPKPLSLSTLSGWSSEQILSVNWPPVEDPSGIAYYEYRIDQGAWNNIGQQTELAIEFPRTAVYEVSVRAVDGKGNTGTAAAVALSYDQTPPQLPGLHHPFPSMEWITEDVLTLNWSSAVDEGSGIQSYLLTINGAAIHLADSITRYQIELLEGANTISLQAVDRVGLMGSPAQIEIHVDRTAPENAAIRSLTHPQEGVWYNNRLPLFEWSAPSDASSIDRYYYEFNQLASMTLNSSNPELSGDQTSFGPTLLTHALAGDVPIFDGIWYFHLVAVDQAGNEGTTNSRQVQIDMTPPLLEVSHEGTQLVDSQVVHPGQVERITLLATDGLSGVENAFYQVDGAAEHVIMNNQLDLSSLADQSLAIYARDVAGNVSDTMILFILPAEETACVATDTLYTNFSSNVAVELRSFTASNGLTFLLEDFYDQLITPSMNIDQFMMGIRFENVEIDSGATVDCARFAFHFLPGTNIPSYDLPVHVYGEANENSLPWEKSVPPSFLPKADISNRAKTNSSLSMAFQFSANSILSDNLAPIIQELVNSPGWEKGNSISFIIDSLAFSKFSHSVGDSIWNRLATVSLLFESEALNTTPYSPLSFVSCPEEIAVNDSFQLSVSLFDPENQYRDAEILVSSSADSIASVDPQTGILVGRSVGTAIISAYVANTSVISRCTVSVIPAIELIDSSEIAYHPIPGRIEAENYESSVGGIITPIEGEENGIKLAELIPGNGTSYLIQVNQAGRYQVDFRIASERTGGTIKMIIFAAPISVPGIVDTSIQVISTSGWNSWDTLSLEIELLAGAQHLALGFLGDENQLIVDLDWMDFHLVNPSFLDVVDKVNDNGTELKVYPNPFSQSIEVDISAFDERVKLEWYDSKGARIWEKIYEPGIHHIADPSISKLANGIYYLRAVNSTEQQVVKIHKY